jgi:hypothetical protein
VQDQKTSKCLRRVSVNTKEAIEGLDSTNCQTGEPEPGKRKEHTRSLLPTGCDWALSREPHLPLQGLKHHLESQLRCVNAHAGNDAANRACSKKRLVLARAMRVTKATLTAALKLANELMSSERRARAFTVGLQPCLQAGE